MNNLELTDDLEVALNCAVRYCIGRQTYMPSLITNYIISIIDKLSDKTIQIFYDDLKLAIEDDKNGLKSLGMDCDKDTWYNFFTIINDELEKRGVEM